MPESDRPSAMLTPSQREHLVDDPDVSDRAKRGALFRIRERVLNSIHDSAILWQHLPAKDRTDIFSAWQDAGERIDEQGGGWLDMWDDDARRERDRFRLSLTSLLAFLYTGIEEGDVSGFEDILTNAIATAEATRNRQVVDVTLDVEYRDQFDTDAIRARFDAGEHLGGFELAHLRSEGEVTPEEMSKYYDRLSGGPPNPGNVDPEEGINFEEVLDEE